MSLNLSPAQAVALAAYGKAFKVARSDSAWPEARTDASLSMQNARKVLSAQEAAVMDMVAGRGWDLIDVAVRAGRKMEELESMFARAAHKLAQHYEARGCI